MDRDELLRRLKNGPLQRVAKELAEAASPCLRLSTERVEMDVLAVGQSRIGGAPDVPAGFVWPTWKGVPQSFIAQLRLDDLADSPLPLPADGWLVFFYDSGQETWGFDPNDRGSFSAEYFASSELLSRRYNDDVPSDGRFSPCKVGIRRELSLPPWESKVVNRLRLSDEEIDAYWDVMDRAAEFMGHQVGGYPEQVQGDMTAELPLVTNGLYLGDQTGWEDPRAARLQEEWRDWRLLLQVASDERTEMMWGDLGYLYFWIKQDLLEAQRFSESWLILQCH